MHATRTLDRRGGGVCRVPGERLTMQVASRVVPDALFLQQHSVIHHFVSTTAPHKQHGRAGSGPLTHPLVRQQDAAPTKMAE